jgi:hypothetical protein
MVRVAKDSPGAAHRPDMDTPVVQPYGCRLCAWLESGAELQPEIAFPPMEHFFRRTALHGRRARAPGSQSGADLQPAMLNARGIVTQYRKLLRVHTKLIYRYAQDLRKRTPLARQP